ncbi:HNH endonuclease [Nodosilinea sp. LEGE 07088]|uniref:HNH endonuclease n=1 Tax=Nodosilinea sp. LEGE 07088 TaxID=2777968 RepID=UPI00187FA44C|nr:HNH endonuclease signature motif containing protein [Nodosilinea sp. LEGE 07088]MBE9140904.1 HNH endonuclease [Nodosilinea sp. LEGE 07088]
MTDYISVALRQLVTQRALGACEYCRIHQTFSIYSHEVDHAIALKHGGQTTPENLVLAWLPCNRHKGSDLTSLDPLMGEITPLFNPRTQAWSEHFQLEGGLIQGLTATGRTTLFLLKMNESSRLQLRQALASQGLYPDLPKNLPNG